jgi:hypothetical protein
MRTACMMLVVALGAGAQGSSQWQEKAWGVYSASLSHGTQSAQSLLDGLREAAALRESAVPEEIGYVTALFDAAIQSGVHIPAAVLQPFESRWPAPVIILLSRDPGAEEALLQVRAAVWREPEWLAASNLLAGMRSRRFLAKVLSEVPISHQFVYREPGYSSGWVGWDSHLFDDNLTVIPDSFPPVGVYVLTSRPEGGDVLVAAGPHSAYYQRIVSPSNPKMPERPDLNLPRGEALIEYLAPLGNLTVEAATALFHRTTRLDFAAADLPQRREAALNAQESDIRAFLRKAQSNGLGSVTGMRLQIVIGDIVHARPPHEFVVQ